MRLTLTFTPQRPNQKLGFQYTYPLAAWIYSRLQAADEAYALFLHESGYQSISSSKRFKHFTFSGLHIPHKAKPIQRGDSVIHLTKEACFLTVSFFVDKAAQDFILGVFANQSVRLYDQTFQADFDITFVEALPTPDFGAQRLYFEARTPMVIARKQENGNDLYLPPDHPDFEAFFVKNLLSKYESITQKALPFDDASAMQLVGFQVEDLSQMKSKLTTVKQQTGSQTQVRGFERFVFSLHAPQDIAAVGYWGGFGKYCAAAGMGFCELLSPKTQLRCTSANLDSSWITAVSSLRLDW